MNSFDLLAHDLYADAIRRLQACKDSSISIPELSSLLRVKSTTLNARLRRQHIAVRMVGRKSFVPGVLALQLAELHKHALIGWPRLRQASQISGVKAGTIKARCEKGQLRSYRDLTKRLRINPSELDGLQIRLRTAKPAPGGARIKASNRPPVVQGMTQTTGTFYVEHGGIRKAPRSAARAEADAKYREIDRSPPASNLPPADPPHAPPIDRGEVFTPLRAAPTIPPIKVVSRRDYSLPEVENPNKSCVSQTKPSQQRSRDPGVLSYNPDKPFSIAGCAVGKTVRYDEYDGQIVGIIDDPFSPQIKVRFAAHPHPLMREVLLLVGKRKVA